MDARELCTCPSCGAAVAAPFCSACGERASSRAELTLRHQLRQVLGGLFNLDGRLWRSLRELLVRPGFLAQEYSRGARVRTMRPVQLFLVANLLYFLLQPATGFNTFHSTLELQLERQIYSDVLRRAVDERLAASGETRAAFGARFDELSAVLERTLVIVLVPCYAVLLAALARRGRTFVEHIVLATHFLAFQLAFVFLPLIWAVGVLVERGFLPRAELEVGVSLLLAAALWWRAALRRFYGESPRAAIVKALLLAAASLPLVLVYRFVLFAATYWIL